MIDDIMRGVTMKLKEIPEAAFAEATVPTAVSRGPRGLFWITIAMKYNFLLVYVLV